MNVTVTGVVWTEALAVIDACQLLEAAIAPQLAKGNYGAGIEDLIIVAVAISEDPAENKKFYEGNTRTDRVKNAMTGEITKGISIGVPMPMDIFKNSQEVIVTGIIDALKKRLPGIKFPKGFKGEVFCRDLVSACEMARSSYGQAET